LRYGIKSDCHFFEYSASAIRTQQQQSTNKHNEGHPKMNVCQNVSDPIRILRMQII